MARADYATYVVLNKSRKPSKIDGKIHDFITKLEHPVAGSYREMYGIAKAVGGSVVRRPEGMPVIPLRG